MFQEHFQDFCVEGLFCMQGLYLSVREFYPIVFKQNWTFFDKRKKVKSAFELEMGVEPLKVPLYPSLPGFHQSPDICPYILQFNKILVIDLIA